MRFLREENGATAIEYGLIASMFAASMIAAFSQMGSEYINMYGAIEAAVVGASNP